MPGDGSPPEPIESQPRILAALMRASQAASDMSPCQPAQCRLFLSISARRLLRPAMSLLAGKPDQPKSSTFSTPLACRKANRASRRLLRHSVLVAVAQLEPSAAGAVLMPSCAAVCVPPLEPP